MATRSSFLTTRYGGYYHSAVPPEDEELTHVGPTTPCGEYLRRFWQPVIFSDDIKELPQRVRLLGEDLVVFRDLSGTVGLLALHCPHRGTSLEFGLVSEHGIRCCYHGWLFDIDGAILETPGEPADSTLKDRLCHGAYPTHEYNGTIFAYLGPPDSQPPFPIYDSFERPGYRLIPGRIYYYPCNWLQILENAMDPVHTAFLHTIVSGSQFTDQFGVVPELDYTETPSGIIYMASRRVQDNIWVRMVEIVLPNIQQVAPIWENGTHPHPFSGPMMTRWIVPVDNTTTMFLEFRHVSETDGDTPDWWADRNIMLPAQLPDSEVYEDRQRQPGDYDAQVGQRPIAVHALEHLGATDRGIIMFRRQVRQGIKTSQYGHDPQGIYREAGQIIPTYCNDTVLPAPAEIGTETEQQLLRRTGQELAQQYLTAPPLLQST